MSECIHDFSLYATEKGLFWRCYKCGKFIRDIPDEELDDLDKLLKEEEKIYEILNETRKFILKKAKELREFKLVEIAEIKEKFIEMEMMIDELKKKLPYVFSAVFMEKGRK